MKIESSQVSMEASSSFKIEQEHSSEFKKQVLETQLSTKDIIKNQNYVKYQSVKLEKVLLVKQSDLTFENRVKKDILEQILGNFADSKFKIHPKNDESSAKPVRIEENSFTYTKTYHQESSISFQSKAFVKTNRGEIHIDLDISFSQSFTQTYSSTFESKKVTFLDPLIINYKNDIRNFDNINHSMKFEFDLNSDGKNELIPELKNGSGFLALDKNQNKTIDNGNELFGANTGDGFAELKAHDKDGNSWIDENDSIFDKLLIWEKNEQGEGSLISLGQAGIGAIYLSAQDSSFTYASNVHENYAQLKQSSFYLKENGKAGLVTSTDFAV